MSTAWSGLGMVLILALLLLLVLVGAVALVVWLLLRRRGEPEAGSSGLCGKCGYAVRGLTSFNCPECGADLREVGIRPASAGRSRGRVIALVAGVGVLVLIGCGCLCSGMLFGVRSSAAPPPRGTLTMPPPPASQPTRLPR